MANGRWRAAPAMSAVLAVAIAVIVLGLALARPASASTGGPGSGLEVSASGSAAEPRLVLTNTTDHDCRIADMAAGLVRFATLEQNGKPIAAAPTGTYLTDRIDRLALDRLETLPAGESRTLALDITTADGATGLMALAPTDTGAAVASFYPIDPAQPLRIAAQYVLPVLPPADVPLCSMADDQPAAVDLPVTAAAQPPADHGRAWWWLAGGGAVLLALVLVLLMLRRGRRRTGAAALAVLLLAGLAVPVARAPHAAADYEPGGSSAAAFDACLAIFRAPGGDPAGVLGALDGKRVVIKGANGESYTTYGGGTVFVNWDSTDTHAYVGGGSAEACSTLYHEMFHGSQLVRGTLNDANCWVPGPFGDVYDTGIRTSEVEAVRAQNQYRTTHGLPERITYGDSPIPTAACQPPPDDADDRSEMCREMGFGCGATNGDPHLTTFDGARYDFQAAGEFVLAADDRSGFQIQVRQEPLAGSSLVAVTTATAMDVAGTRVAVGTGGALLIDGTAVADSSTALVGGGRVDVLPGRRGPLFTVTWPDGSMAQVSEIANYGLLVVVRPAAGRMGHLSGLLGNFDGDKANDISARNGTALAIPPDFAALYPAYADSWRITQAGSLLSYVSGKSTGSYTVRPFPTRAVSAADVANAAGARAACIAAGVTDPQSLDDCILDVGLTGSVAFADAAAAASAQQPTGTIAIDGPSAEVTAAAGSPALLSFTAAAGQQVYVDVSGSTLPDQCGALEIRAPGGSAIASGCLIGGGGSIDRTVLASAGQYTLAIAPQSGSGTLTVRIVGSESAAGQLAPDGPPVTATVAAPGGEASFTFTATAGTRVFVAASDSDFPDQCGIIDLLDPAGVTANFGCVTQGAGFIDATLLTTTGTYTVAVDPDGAATGQLTLRLTTAVDQNGPIAVNGPALKATVGQPGAVASFAFDAAAGQTVSVAATGSTFPDQCSILQVLAPNGAAIATGCATGGSGSLDDAVLPAAGTYRVVVDPYGADTGVMTIRLTD